MRTGSRIALVVLLAIASSQATAQTKYASHAPMRPLPVASTRPATDGPAFHVDPVKGDDRQDGSKDKPWKTLAHAVKQLKPGETLHLHGGTYYETVTLSNSGTADRPITLRSHPGELAVIDGGVRDFAEEPGKAWEPVEKGKEGEYRSVKAYPGLGEIVLGHFGDSMIPLHGYRNLIDLRSDNEYALPEKLSTERGFYCGPGIWYDAKSGRLHGRFAPTTLPVLGDDNYKGETDPRKLVLHVAGPKTPLEIKEAKHLRIQDIVIRGGSRATVHIAKSEGIELDGVTVYGGNPALRMQSSQSVRILNSGIRGIAAPWSSRAGHKYRGVAAYLLVAGAEGGVNRDVEIAHSELTDSHDGPYIGSIKGLKFHHNLVDNFNDDGVYLTAQEAGGDVHIYQNVLSRCLHVFSFAGSYKPGSGVWVYRNLIDMRRGVHYLWPTKADDPYFQPKKPGEPPRFPWAGRIAGDHGSPTWEPMNFYHNTVVARDPAFRDFYAAGLGGHVNSKRRLFNNIFVQIEDNPGLNFSTTDDTLLEADGNLLWGAEDGAKVKGDFFAAFRASDRFKMSKKHYAPGWGANDVFADPQFVQFTADPKTALDVRLQKGNKAIDAGVAIPEDWPDPLRKNDRGRPDIGALPIGAEALIVGIPKR